MFARIAWSRRVRRVSQREIRGGGLRHAFRIFLSGDLPIPAELRETAAKAVPVENPVVVFQVHRRRWARVHVVEVRARAIRQKCGLPCVNWVSLGEELLSAIDLDREELAARSTGADDASR